MKSHHDLSHLPLWKTLSTTAAPASSPINVRSRVRLPLHLPLGFRLGLRYMDFEQHSRQRRLHLILMAHSIFGFQREYCSFTMRLWLFLRSCAESILLTI